MWEDIYFEEIKETQNQFPNLSKLDLLIITFHKLGFSYGNIQLKTGNPSKKYIRSILLKYIPELIVK